MSDGAQHRPLAGRLIEMLGVSLAGCVAFAALSSLGSFVVFRASWVGQGIARALGSQLTSPWLLTELAYLLLLPAAAFAVQRVGPRRAALRWPLLALGLALPAAVVPLVVTGRPGAGAVAALLTMLLAAGAAALRRRTALALLVPTAYGLYVLGGLMPSRGLTVELSWTLGLEAPLSMLAQVLLIEAPRLVVLTWLLLRWRSAFQETEPA